MSEPQPAYPYIQYKQEKQVLSEMSPGFEKAVLREIQWHKGKDHAISQDDLLSAISTDDKQGTFFGKKVNKRQLRITINELRKMGWMIASSSGSGGSYGYYVPVTYDEYQEYKKFQMSYALDIIETFRVLDVKAREMYSDEINMGQASLF